MEASKGVCPVGGAGGNRRYVQWVPVKGCVQWEGLVGIGQWRPVKGCVQWEGLVGIGQWRPVKGCVQWEGLSYGGGGSSH